MLGRVRAASSSVCSLEMERPGPSKIVKQDSLSIYESTLLKLKQGSHCNPSIALEDSARMDDHSIMESKEPMTSDAADCHSTDSFRSSCSSFKSIDSSKDPECRNTSIMYMFSKYKTLQDEQRTKGKEVMTMGTGSSSSSCCSLSPTSSC